MKWEVFYEKINEWAVSTSKSKISSLEDIGSADEVTEAINTLAFDDEKAATKLLNKAMSFGVKFSGENLAELTGICDEEVFNKALYDSASSFNGSDLEELYGCIDDDVILDIAKKYRLKLPADMAAEYEEEFCTDTSSPITWDYFYENYSNWSMDFAAERFDAVQDYGNVDELIEVLRDLFDTSKASKIIQKLLEAGVRFSIDNLLEIIDLCDESVANQAVRLSASGLSDDDIEELYGYVDDSLIEEICRLHHKALPEAIREVYEEQHKELIAEALEQAGYALDCLYELQDRLDTSSTFSILDMFTTGFIPSLLKYSALNDSDVQMETAMQALSDLNNSLKELQKNPNIRMKYTTLSSVIDLWFDSRFVDMMVHLQINKLHKKTKTAINQVKNIIRELETMMSEL